MVRTYVLGRTIVMEQFFLFFSAIRMVSVHSSFVAPVLFGLLPFRLSACKRCESHTHETSIQMYAYELQILLCQGDVTVKR
jgi:hypothetical protein